MGVQDEAERVEPGSADEWAAWLAAHHRDAPGVWLVSYREAARRAFDYETAVVEALRFGWIDSVVRRLDDERTMQWFSPRRAGSGWARSNKDRIARLEREGRLEPAGRAVVETARADGSWELYDSVERLEVPDDLAAALDARPGARALGGLLPVGTPDAARLDRAGQAARDARAAGGRDRRQGRARAPRRRGLTRRPLSPGPWRTGARSRPGEHRPSAR